ncbi:hypothetical protein V8D89_013835 [Ganoderma adspersum]
MVVEMRAERSNDEGDGAQMEESMMAFLWVSGGVIEDGGEVEGMGDGIDGGVGVEWAWDEMKAAMKLRLDDGTWAARRQVWWRVDSWRSMNEVRGTSWTFACGCSGGVSNDAAVDLEGATDLATGVVSSTEAIVLKQNRMGRDELRCTPLLKHCELPSHFRQPLLVVDMGDKVAVCWSRYWRSRVRCWLVEELLLSLELNKHGLRFCESPSGLEELGLIGRRGRWDDRRIENVVYCRRDLIDRVLMPRKKN